MIIIFNYLPDVFFNWFRETVIWLFSPVSQAGIIIIQKKIEIL